MLCLIQLESENAKLKQKLSNFPSYSKVPKPIDPPDKADFNAAKTVVYEAKLEANKSVGKVNQEHLASKICCDLVGGLLWTMTTTVLNFMARNASSLCFLVMLLWPSNKWKTKHASSMATPLRNLESGRNYKH